MCRSPGKAKEPWQNDRCEDPSNAQRSRPTLLFLHPKRFQLMKMMMMVMVMMRLTPRLYPASAEIRRLLLSRSKLHCSALLGSRWYQAVEEVLASSVPAAFPLAPWPPRDRQ